MSVVYRDRFERFGTVGMAGKTTPVPLAQMANRYASDNLALASQGPENMFLFVSPQAIHFGRDQCRNASAYAEMYGNAALISSQLFTGPLPSVRR